MAKAHVEIDGQAISLDEYEGVPQIISEFETTAGPGVQDLYMMLYIQNQRLYDLVGLLISLLGHDDALRNVMELHKQGRVLAPDPFLDIEG